jgi:hypothetical protein
LLDKHVELWRVEPVFHSLDLHSIFRIPLFDTLLFTVAFSLTILVWSWFLLVLEVVQAERFNNVLFDLTRANVVV